MSEGCVRYDLRASPKGRESRNGSPDLRREAQGGVRVSVRADNRVRASEDINGGAGDSLGIASGGREAGR